ncbi:5-oxoprolinase subunit PxpB [Marinomonas pollencensis]|uniref:KipI family sensor histidine kinase inhibitor n=1 Tax=Marinomonas pollencensis TaxID=491954 RepID=A0A3E0DNR4_9GAMM|nr:5-oxoprolinase subunit PxpB [Marinomonas pollencensis]REG83789.1 KipI family sensor histidine kinase inhibitor [Marinomonas pollencensis]
MSQAEQQPFEFGQITIEMVNEQSCLLRFADHIDDTVADAIGLVTLRLRDLDGIIDTIPSYTSLLVTFAIEQYDQVAICQQIQSLLNNLDMADIKSRVSREIVIPVYYAEEVGPDLQEVADHCGMTVEEVIQLHSQTTYRAYAIGFTPGFAFLGNTPEVLHVPRKNTPRLKVPTGSVAIAERQTAVYPGVSPGGWQILGRTPTPLVDWQSDSLALIEVGDNVRFEAISQAEFIAQGGQLDGF